jgi:hypothetical protein
VGCLPRSRRPDSNRGPFFTSAAESQNTEAMRCRCHVDARFSTLVVSAGIAIEATVVYCIASLQSLVLREPRCSHEGSGTSRRAVVASAGRGCIVVVP